LLGVTDQFGHAFFFARLGAAAYFGAGFGGGGLPDEFSVFAGEPVEAAVAGSRGSRVTAPVVVAVPGAMAGDPETVEPVPVAVGRSERPPDAPDGGVETCAWAAPVARQAAKTAPIDSLSMALSCGRKRARKHDSQTPPSPATFLFATARFSTRRTKVAEPSVEAGVL